MSKPYHPLLEDYPLVMETDVKWGEMDAFNHVNNTVYFRYFEDIRIRHFDDVGVNEYMRSHNVGPILGSTQCRFKAPLTYPDHLYIGLRTRQLKDDRMVHEYAVVSQQLNRMAAEGSGQVVFYDYNAGAKARIPDSLRNRILEFDPLATT